MTYHTPHGWRVTARGPLHAAAAGGSAPLRRQLRRALRLFVAAGAWGAGLCLIVGSVALVAEASGGGRPSHVTATPRAYHLGTGAPDLGSRTGRRPLSRLALARFDGTGNAVTREFQVAPDSNWLLAWSYRCPAWRPGRRLLIRQNGAAGSGLIVSAAGDAARGSTWTYSAASQHYLVVTSGCSWTIQVTGRP